MPFWAARGAAVGVVLARRSVRTAAALIHLAPGCGPDTDPPNCVRQIRDADACSRHEITAVRARRLSVVPERHPCNGNFRARPSTAPATQADSTLITALVTQMYADPGGSVTRGWVVLRPANIEIETEIVVLSTFWPVRSMVLVRVGRVKLNGTLTPLAVNWPVPLANQYRLRWSNRPPACW
jgi:hypothetical protein